MKEKIIENNNFKLCVSKDYNFIFNKNNGFFARWGRNKNDDPSYSPIGPEILDIEISTICNGINGKPCSFCYKTNTNQGTNMSFDTFKTIFNKFPKSLTQIAFGIGDIDSNPDLWKIMEFTRENGVIPNITINGWNLTDEYTDKLAKVCGAIAVSCYDPKDICYNAIKKLTDRIKPENTLKQVNIHQLVAKQTFNKCIQVMKDKLEDKRLQKLNAIVFLALKPKGDRNVFSKLGLDKYKEIVNFSFKNNIPVGFDSCSAPMFLNAIKDRKDYKKLEQLVEPCESYLFSFYVNVDGKTVPCSFLENESNFKPIDLLEVKNFLKEVWNIKDVKKWRNTLLTTEICNICRKCPVFNIY